MATLLGNPADLDNQQGPAKARLSLGALAEKSIKVDIMWHRPASGCHVCHQLLVGEKRLADRGVDRARRCGNGNLCAGSCAHELRYAATKQAGHASQACQVHAHLPAPQPTWRTAGLRPPVELQPMHRPPGGQLERVAGEGKGEVGVTNIRHCWGEPALGARGRCMRYPRPATEASLMAMHMPTQGH